jgi:hypothetical protein
MVLIRLFGVALIVAAALVPTVCFPAQSSSSPAVKLTESRIQFFAIAVAGVGIVMNLTTLPFDSKYFHFSIRDMLWLTVVLGLAFGWWVDHRNSITKWSRLHYWVEPSTGKIEFSPGDTMDGAHKFQGEIEFQSLNSR